MNISANGSDVCGESLMFFRCPIRNKGDIHSQYRRAKPRFVKCSGKTTLVSMHLNESRLASLPFRWQFLAFCYFIYTKVYRLDSTPWLYVVSLVFFFLYYPLLPPFLTSLETPRHLLWMWEWQTSRCRHSAGSAQTNGFPGWGTALEVKFS